MPPLSLQLQILLFLFGISLAGDHLRLQVHLSALLRSRLGRIRGVWREEGVGFDLRALRLLRSH